MAEFKINPVLTKEISALREAGRVINDGYTTVSSDDVSTLKTSVSIIDQHSRIKRLLNLYLGLLLRDAQDLDDLVAEAREMDATIALSHKI